MSPGLLAAQSPPFQGNGTNSSLAGCEKLICCILLIIVSLGLQEANAAIIQSNGTGGGDWNAGSSWSGGFTPLATDDVIILAGDVINANSNQTCVNLQISGSLNFNTNSVTITVNGNLTFSGSGSTSNGSASRSLNVNGNLLSLTGADGSISGINLSISGTTNLQGRIVFTNSGGSKTLTGDVTIANGGAIDFSAGGISIILINNLIMSGTSSLAGTSGSTGTIIGVNSFTVNAGAIATIGRVTIAIVGLTTINGVATFSSASGTKTFVGACTINNGGAIEFSAAASVNLNNTFTINGNTSVGGSSSATGNLTVGGNFTVSNGASLSLGRTLTVNGLTSVSGAIDVVSTTGTKTFTNDVTINATGSISFSAAETVDIATNLVCNPGGILGGGSATGIVNVGGNFSANTGGSSFINNLTLNISGNVSVPGTAAINTSGGTSTISVGGNWNITSSDPNPFVEGTSRVIFNGTSGTQSINTTEAGGETFYNLTINNSSPSSPGLSTSVNLNARSLTYTNGMLDLAGRNLTITGDGTSTTDTYSAGSIITSVAGSNYIVTDPSITKTVNYTGVQIGNPSFGISTTVTCSSSTFSNSIFYGNASFTKTGTSSSECSGGNIYYGPVSFITIAGADRWRMGNSNGDVFYNATFTHNGNNNFIVARSSFGNEFYGTTTISSSTSGGFYVGRNNNGSSGSSVFHGPVISNITLTGNILFGESNATFQHTHTFESTIEINSTASSTGDVIFGSTGFGSINLTPTAQFIAGTILGASTVTLVRVTQNGTGLNQTISAGGTSIINIGGAGVGDGCVFNANVNFTAPQVRLRTSSFNGAANSFLQTGTVANQTFGGNTFATGTMTTFTNQGTGAWRLGNSGGDDYNGDVTFVRQGGAGALEVAYTNNSTFAGNVSTLGTATAITFGNNGGRATFDGSGAMNLSGNSSFSPIFVRLSMNGTGSLTLNVPTTITTNLDLTAGVINSSSTNLLTMNAGSTVTGSPGNASHIDGPVRKIGNTAFTFPVGDGGIGRSIAITAPAVASDAFTAEYFKSAQAFGGSSTYDPSFATLSSCEYWVLDRTNGASNVSVTLSWNSPDCTGPYITDPSTLRVARWTGASWVSHGNGGTTGNATTGTIVSSGTINSFSPITIASTSLSNPLPIELVEFNAIPFGDVVNLSWSTLSELNNDYFTVERSISGNEFETLADIKAAGTTNLKMFYGFVDRHPLPGLSYYRLKQTDFDGAFTYSGIVRVNSDFPDQLKAYPNPVAQSGLVILNYKDSFALFNSLGQMVLFVDDTNQFDTKGLPAGVYTIKGASGNHTRLVIE